jgi:DNA-directed RNA polymerase subunit RPC12/RpoP
MYKVQSGWLLLCFLLLVMAGTAVAQSDNALSLRLSRDFGTGIGSNIQGTFSYRVSGPDKLASVTFYLDDQIIGEDSEEPFRLQFKTEDYPLGVHTFSAIGLTEDGQELTSNSLSRNFISGSDATRSLLYIVVPILLLSFGGTFISWWLTSRKSKASGKDNLTIQGPWGGTICPKCNKPFARHAWGLNIGFGKYDRCPHCGKWSIVRRVHPDILNASVEAMRQANANNVSNSATDGGDDEASRRKRLDDSRFDS